jgi:hypothetical protein
MRHHHRQFGAAPSDLYNCYRCGALWQTVIRLRVLGRDKWDRYRCDGRTNEMHHRSYYALLACFGASPWHLAMSPHRALMGCCRGLRLAKRPVLPTPSHRQAVLKTFMPTLNEPSVGTQGGCLAFRDDSIGPTKASRFSVSPKARFLAPPSISNR